MDILTMCHRAACMMAVSVAGLLIYSPVTAGTASVTPIKSVKITDPSHVFTCPTEYFIEDKWITKGGKTQHHIYIHCTGDSKLTKRLVGPPRPPQ